MPTYDYVCEACGHEMEEFQSITAKPLKKCPECGKNKLNRLIGAGAGLIFKGSGFYTTDYRSDNYKSRAEADKKSAASSSSSSSDSKSDKSDKKSGSESSKPEKKKASGSKSSKSS